MCTVRRGVACGHCRGVACNAPTACRVVPATPRFLMKSFWFCVSNAATVIRRYYDKRGVAGLWDLQDFPNCIELILQNPINHGLDINRGMFGEM